MDLFLERFHGGNPQGGLTRGPKVVQLWHYERLLLVVRIRLHGPVDHGGGRHQASGERRGPKTMRRALAITAIVCGLTSTALSIIVLIRSAGHG